jgi:HD-GYP domain-containing protein (c-di-GMP phosphodiesterase class II)
LGEWLRAVPALQEAKGNREDAADVPRENQSYRRDIVTNAVQDEIQRGIRLSLDGAWDVLDRFGLALQQCEQAHDQIALVLEAIRDSLSADVVFWHPGSSGDSFERTGTVTLSAQWAADFVADVAGAANVPERLVQQFLDPAAKRMAPWPCSAALARISRTRGSWLVALSFHPRRLFTPADLRVMLLARRMLLNHRQQAQVYEKLRDSLFGMVRCLTAAIDAKDPFTWGHSERVARIAVRLGKQMGLTPAVLSDLYLAGLLHDIGKIGIRDSVLQKPGKLNEEELAHIKQHPVIGDRLVSNVRPLDHLRAGVRNHHERWDGNGYPDGLAGEAIPMQARLLAVADSCDAMMAARPYRSGMPPAEIDAIMLAGAGRQWDPDIIAHFMTCRHELYSICQRGLGDSVLTAVERALRLGDSGYDLVRGRAGTPTSS